MLIETTGNLYLKNVVLYVMITEIKITVDYLIAMLFFFNILKDGIWKYFCSSLQTSGGWYW